MVLVGHYDLLLHQMDVKTTFMNAELEEKNFMRQPEEFAKEAKEHMVCKLGKTIYGLNQASRRWYFIFHQTVSSYGFEENIADQDRARGLLGLSQKTYIERVLKRFDMSMCYGQKVPLAKEDLKNEHCPMNKEEEDDMRNKPYASLIGSITRTKKFRAC
ncbi:unnamed protein product [Prunus brigantina]